MIQRLAPYRAALLMVVLARLAVAGWTMGTPAVVDGNWHPIPGSGRTLSQPVGVFIPAGKNSQFAHSVGVVIRGADDRVYYQTYSLTSESWSGKWSSLNLQTSADAFTFVGDAWDVVARDPKTGNRLHTINWGNGWTVPVDDGPGDLAWGSPTETDDTRDRHWSFRLGPHDTVEYRCQTLAQLAARPSLELRSHLGYVNCVAFSPDGRTLASGGRDCRIFLWDVASGAPRRVLTGHTEHVRSLAWSPDGALLASGSEAIRFWDPQSGAPLRKLDSPAAAVAFSPDGQTLASGIGDTVRLWDVPSSRRGEMAAERRELTGHRGVIYSLAFSPDGRQLVVASGEEGRNPEPGPRGSGELRVWDVQTGAVQWRMPLRVDEWQKVDSVAFSPNGETIAAGESRVAWRDVDSPLIQLRDARTGALQRALAGHSGGVLCIAFSPDSQTLISGSDDGKVRFWNARTGAGLKTLLEPPDWGGANSLSLSRDGRLLATACGWGTVKLWDVQRGVLRRTLGWTDAIASVAISADGKLIASGGSSHSRLRVWDAQTGALKWIPRETAGVASVAFTRDSRTLVSASEDGGVTLWDLQTRTVRRTLEGEARPNWVVLSPDDKLLARPTPGNEFAFWELESGEPVRTLPGHNQDPGVAFSPDGRMVATCASPEAEDTPAAIQLWDAGSWQPLRTLQGHQGSIRGMAFSPDSTLLAAGNRAGIWLWDVETGELRRTLPTGLNDRGLAFAPHRPLLADPEWDTIHLLNVPTGLQVRWLKADMVHEAASVAFSSDGSRLVSGGSDHTVRIWEVSTGRLLATLITLPAPQPDQVATDWVSITPDGYYDASPGAARFVEWKVGNDLFPVEAYEKSFHRPDLLRRALASTPIPTTPTLRRFAAGQAVPPQVIITHPHDGQSISGSSVRVELTVTDPHSDIRVEVHINGRPVATKPITVGGKPISVGSKTLPGYGKLIEVGAESIQLAGRPIPPGARPITVGGKPLPAAHRFLQQLSAEVPLPLGETQVTLKAIATDADALQGWAELRLYRPLAGAAGASTTHGDLHVLTIGVSRYHNPHYNLKYAAADALAFARLWPPMAGSLYDHVQVTPLLDAQATTERIQSELFKLLRTVSRQDSLALFLSGHGVQGTGGGFYFATHNIDASSVERLAATGLPWTVFETILAKVEAKRVFLFLDACHSGSALGEQEATNERLAEALARHGNVLVFSSSRGGEYSYEDPALHHGAFTAALLEGIGEGKADLAVLGKRDGRITAAKLLTYLQERVPELTQNRQTPTCPLLYDFGEEFLLARAR